MQEESEADFEEAVGDYASEAPMLDPEILRDCGDLADDPDLFYVSEKYIQFVSLIDYESNPLDEVIVAESSNRRRLAQSARDILNSSEVEL